MKCNENLELKNFQLNHKHQNHFMSARSTNILKSTKENQAYQHASDKNQLV